VSNDCTRSVGFSVGGGAVCVPAISSPTTRLDNSLEGARLELLDLASGHPVKGDNHAAKAALADLEGARESKCLTWT
jgi:hypothetical protein